MKMAGRSPDWWKTMLEKQKLLLTSNFSLCFQKTCAADTRNQGLFGKGLTDPEVEAS